MGKKLDHPKKNFIKNQSFIAIIPARGNSQRIKNKNLINLNGKPLIYWTLQSAIKSKHVSDICVTSDSKKILNYCKKYNVKTILRPKNLSGNIIMPDEAIKHSYLKIKKKFDYIVMLQPTSPLRTAKDIDNAIEVIIRDKADSLFSSSIQSKFIWRQFKNTLSPVNYNFKSRPRHQDISFYYENGAIYVSKPNLFTKHSNRLGGKISTYVMPDIRSIDIDNKKDLKDAEKIMKIDKKKKINDKFKKE
jgi:CMP-N-acetylneuraminic acid synthetase